MAINPISNMMNSKFRLTGLSTGLDTDTIIADLMKVERVPLQKIYQKKQLSEWKRDDYRSMVNTLRSFRDEYFDVLKPATNFRSQSAFSASQATTSNATLLSATAGTDATPGTHTVVVKSLASGATKTGSTGVSAGVTGDAPVDMSKMKQGKQFNITLDGVARTITLDADYTASSAADFRTALSGLVNNAFGSGKISVSESGGTLSFAAVTASSNLSISDSTNTYLSTLGLSDGQQNALTSGSITDFTAGNFKMSVDGGATIDIHVASATDRGTLLVNINTALASAGQGSVLKAVADPDTADKIKFVTYDTTQQISLTSGDTDDLLAKVGVSSGTSVGKIDGTLNFATSDIGKDFYIEIDGGTSIHLDLTTDYTDPTQGNLQAVLQNALNSNGFSDVQVSVSGGKINFQTNGRLVTMNKGDDGLRDELGFSSAQASGNRINTSDTLANISNSLATPFTFGSDGKLSFTINGEAFSFNQTDTLSTVMNTVNNSNANVKMKYDSLNDKFIMETKTMGAAAVIDNSDDLVDGDNFFSALKIKTTAQEAGGTALRGTDASITLDGTTLTRESNDFTASGIAFSLKSYDAGEPNVTVTVSANTDELVGKIKSFLSKYNEVVDVVNNKLGEERSRNYVPLTNEQKSAMNAEDVVNWESKAKSGLLRNDSLLSGVVNNMRKSLYDSIYTNASDEGTKLTQSLSSVGISTSSIYSDKGKLVLNETKLREALASDPDKVMQLFTKDDSGVSYSDAINDSSKRTERYKESGLAHRLYDIIQDSIRTTRNLEGKKGSLLEKAGITGDISEFSNMMYDEIKGYDSRITELNNKLVTKESKYYAKFASLERVIGQMNSQGQWLSGQLGQS